MLPILYILQRCNTLQSLGGNFPHRALARWGCALTCVQMGGQGAQSLCKLLPDLGCSAVKQDPSSSSFSPPPYSVPITASRAAEAGDGAARGCHHRGETPTLSLSRTIPQAKPSPDQFCAGGHCPEVS